MPNTYIKPEKYVGLALAQLAHDTVFASDFVTRYDGGNFVGAKDDSVTYRLPGVTRARDYEWRTRTAPIKIDEIYRTVLSIKLDTHTYQGVGATDEEMTLDVSSFQDEIVTPQVNALTDRLEGKVLLKLQNANFKTTNLDASEATDDPFRFMLRAKSILDAQHTPAAGRTLLVGSAVEPWLLDSDKLRDSDPSQAQTAYREAVLSRGAGFNILSSGQIASTAIYALHPSWCVLANVAPAVMPGMYSARNSFRGFSLRVLRDYDADYLQMRNILSTFTGLTEVADEYKRFATGDVIPTTGPNAGAQVGDIIIGDGTSDPLTGGEEGQPIFTGLNVRGARGTFTPAA